MISKNNDTIPGIRECVSQKHEQLGVLPDEDDILNVEIPFDGTWMKRGHTSHTGAAAIMEVH